MSLERIALLLWDYRAAFGQGILITVQLSFVAMLISLVGGLVLCLASLSPTRFLRWPTNLLVEFFRNTPILVQVVWVHFALPELIGVKFSAITSSIIALAMQSSGYLAEEYRAGIESIDRGQFEAAQSLGMTYPRLMRRIVIPQAVMRMLPGILNQFVTCFKSTSIVSVIAVPDLMYQAGLIVSATFLPMPIYTAVALMYFLMVLSVSWLVNAAAHRLPSYSQFVRRPEAT
jgi:polar amino acid transport system permease protein